MGQESNCEWGHRVVRFYPSGSACHVGRRCQPWLPDRHEAKAGDKVRNAMELGTHKPEVRDAELRLAKRLVDELDVLRMISRDAECPVPLGHFSRVTRCYSVSLLVGEHRTTS